MKFTKMASIINLMMAMFSWKDVPVENGSLKDLSPEQEAQLQAALGPKADLKKVTAAINSELADMAQAKEEDNDEELQDLRKEAREMLLAHGLSQEDSAALLENPSTASTASQKEILAGLIKNQKDMDAKLQKLIKEPEEDAPIAKGNIKNLMNLHSKSHFLGTGAQWDAFEGRNWNQRAAGLTKTPTDFAAEDKVEIQKLKNDVDLYYRENPTEINSLHRDLLGLPDFWNIRTNVDDKVADGNIVSGEISQARKKNWLPKNKQLIQPEESQIFPVHIDIEHQGYYLQQIEASWLNSWNKEGSSPFKMSFVRFLLSELDKKARQEDRMVAINGVYVKTPDNEDTVPGSAINRGDGLLVQLYRAFRYDNKFKQANIGLPTKENIVDYVKDMIIKNIPEESKNTPGFVLYCSPTWLRNYRERYRIKYGLEPSYTKSDVQDIENFPNVRFQSLRDLEGSDFMFITDEDNIELMENVPGEKSMYRFDSLKRNVFIYADYKWGARFKHIGTKVKDTDPVAFKVQTVWCNIPPYLANTFVPLFDDTTGEISLPYDNIETKTGWATNITDIKNTYAGQIVKIKGAAAGVAGNVVSTGNIALTGGNFSLATGGVLTLVVNSDLSLKEIRRTVEPETAPSQEVQFNSNSIDATEGSTFNHAGGVNVVLDSILNGYEGQTITVNAADDANTVTINDVAGNIDVGAQRVLTAEGDFVKFTLVDGVWTEVDFNQA